MEMFSALNAEGITVILVTHSVEIANFAKRTIHVQDGLIVSGSYGG
jgi:ABC-type lipoprotein export system ATPase subunit